MENQEAKINLQKLIDHKQEIVDYCSAQLKKPNLGKNEITTCTWLIKCHTENIQWLKDWKWSGISDYDYASTRQKELQK